MKKTILFIFLAVCISIQAQQNIDITMGGQYVNNVYFKLSDESSLAMPANSWDIAFLRTSAMDHGIRVNDNIGIQVFEASNTPSDWASIAVSQESSWTQLYNSDTDWQDGAFMQGSATYGWGEYDFSSHHIQGTIIFVLKYTDGTYRKFICEDYFGGYTIKYATWDGSAWSADQTAIVMNTTNPTHSFNYYSLQNDQQMLAAPEDTAWDLVFTRYTTDLGGGTYYLVSGCLHKAGIEIAENDEPTGASVDLSGLNYSSEMNIIGYDWKSFNGSGFDIDTEKAFYVKTEDNEYYRISFTAFGGSGTGEVSFTSENVSASLSVDEFSTLSLGVFPNPSIDRNLTLVLDGSIRSGLKTNVSLYSALGQKVYHKEISYQGGFYQKELNLDGLTSGVYVLVYESGDSKMTQKVVLQ